MYINHMFHVLSRKCDWNMKRIKCIVLHRLMLMFKLEDVWSCHTRGRRLSSYSQIPWNCAAFDTNNKEENPIDPTSSSTTSSDGLFCSSLLLQNLVCIVHRISLLPMGQLWARSYHYKSGFFKEAPWSRNWVDHSCNSLWLGKVWQFNGAAILDLHHIGSKKIQKKQSQYASEFESLITFSFSSLICQHLPIHPSPKTHRLPTTANILWRCRTIVTSCLAEVVLTKCSPTDGIIKPMNPSLGRGEKRPLIEEDACATRIQFLQVRKSFWICPFWPAHCHEHWRLSLSVLCIHLGNIAINITMVCHIEEVLVNLIGWCKGANTLFC